MSFDIRVFVFGGAKRDRTADLNTASVALSQLSYSPKVLLGLRPEAGRIVCSRFGSVKENIPLLTPAIFRRIKWLTIVLDSVPALGLQRFLQVWRRFYPALFACSYRNRPRHLPHGVSVRGSCRGR
jgi:hypothetical protein